ncbi:hypothetical protein FRC10_001783, partial [Ceratobasidium sp. 414]
MFSRNPKDMSWDTVILGGYAMSLEDLEAWSAREAETNPVYKRCLEKKQHLVVTLGYYVRKKKLDIRLHYPPKDG